MTARSVVERPLTLLGITIRRSIIIGRASLIYGTAVSLILGVALSTSPSSFSGFPIFLPIFTVVGSLGALMVFTSDRVKGVLEYLMAYGVSPRRLFGNVLLASLALATIVLALALSIGLGVYVAFGNALSDVLVALLAFYAIPMSYASAAFAATVGMYWSALSSPRQGLNSPIGLAPFIGILPSVATLGSIVVLGVLGYVSSSSSSTFIIATSLSLAIVAGIVVVLLSMIGRFLRRERLLSPS